MYSDGFWIVTALLFLDLWNYSIRTRTLPILKSLSATLFRGPKAAALIIESLTENHAPLPLKTFLCKKYRSQASHTCRMMHSSEHLQNSCTYENTILIALERIHKSLERMSPYKALTSRWFEDIQDNLRSSACFESHQWTVPSRDVNKIIVGPRETI